MKTFDSFFYNAPYTMLVSDGNRIELPICSRNFFGAEAVCEPDDARITSCGKEESMVNGNLVDATLLKPDDIVRVGSLKLRYNVVATGTRRLAVFASESNDINRGKLRSRIITPRELREKQARVETKVTNPPVITISRQLGSGGTEIAQKLGNQLGWDVWDSEIIDRIANDANVSREMVEILDERRVSALEEMARALFSANNIIWETYLRHLVGAIMAIGQQGNAIIVGRGANFILPKALNLRITASFDYRVETLIKQYDISQREAERRIVKSDHDREEFVRKAFGADIDDVALYDLILRMNEFGKNAIQIIRTTAQMKFKDLEI